MTGVKKGLQSLLEDPKSSTDRGLPFSGSAFSSDQTRIVVRRGHSQMVSLWTCSKLCAVGFILGVVVGCTFKRRVRRWAAKVLKRLKDD